MKREKQRRTKKEVKSSCLAALLEGTAELLLYAFGVGVILLLGGKLDGEWLDSDLLVLIGLAALLGLLGILSAVFKHSRRIKNRKDQAAMHALCDLHTHSTFSDGTKSPEALVDEASALGLSAVALTDHNTLKGLLSFLSAAKQKKLTAVAGIEISSDYEGTELHIVGLFLKEEHYGAINSLLAEMKRNKEKSNVELVARLNAAGYLIDYDEVKASATDGNINRAHIASLLTQKGYTESVKEAFDTLLAKGGGYYEEAKRIPSLKVISFLNSIGAVSVLAHPLVSMNEEALRAFLPQAREAGLDAIETHYSTYSREETALATELAHSYGLLESGGSDYHADRKPDIFLGVGRGTLAVPYSFYEALKTRYEVKNK